MPKLSRPLASPPLPRGRWPRGHKKAVLCRRMERVFQTCGGVGAPCRAMVAERALSAGCSWAIRRVNKKPYTGRIQS